jgi:L-gulono-1,4-lactone dehydrogenase
MGEPSDTDTVSDGPAAVGAAGTAGAKGASQERREPTGGRGRVSATRVPDGPATSWRNWAGDQVCRPAGVETPASIAQICDAIGRAATGGHRVRVAGSGHSFSDIALTDGVQLHLDRLERVLDVDHSSGLVRVQAGIRIRDLNQRLAEHGLAMENLGDVDAQTLAGAISTATHGTGARLRNISAQVAELTLVLADGSTLHCAEHLDADTFRAARVSLGALGVIAEVTLRCVPAFTLRGVDAPKPLTDTLARFEELALGNDHFEMYAFPHADVALTRTNNRVDSRPLPRGRISAYANDILLTNHAFALACLIGRRFPGGIPEINRIVTRLAGASTRVDRSDRIFTSPRLVRFTEMEYALPRAATPEAVRRVMALVPDRGFDVPFPIEARTVAGDDALLSTAGGRDSGFVAVHMFEGMAWEPYFRAVGEIMDELGGRPHWGKRHFQTAATLRSRYPEWERFEAVRARLDPGGRFANDYTDRVLGPVDA